MTMTPARGYTLLEMVVAVAIFSIVMLFVTSAYITMIKLDKESRATNELTANLSFAVESMARNIRTGTGYGCPGDGTCSRFAFTDSSGQAITYLVKSDGTLGQCTGGACTAGSAVSLTDTRITLTGITFKVVGSAPGDGLEPRVLINLQGTMPSGSGTSVGFVIQTGATERRIDL